MNPALREIVLDSGITPDPLEPLPVPPEYWPKLDFTDYRNSMYSVGGF